MALSDWEQYGADDISLTSQVVYAGDQSLLIDGTTGNNTRRILKQSETDAPSEGRVVTRKHEETDTGTRQGVTFRFQDPDNWYHLSVDQNSQKVRLHKKIGGVYQGVNGENDYDLSSGTWQNIRVTWYVDGGELFAQAELEVSGSWELLGSQIVDGANDLSGGGGIGIGTSNGDQGNIGSLTYYDETEVFY